MLLESKAAWDMNVLTRQPEEERMKRPSFDSIMSIGLRSSGQLGRNSNKCFPHLSTMEHLFRKSFRDRCSPDDTTSLASSFLELEYRALSDPSSITMQGRLLIRDFFDMRI